MPTTPIEQQQNDSEQLAQAVQLYRQLRSLRGQLEIEQQQAMVTNDAAKRAAIRLALKTTVEKKSVDTILRQLDEIEKAQSPWVPSATRAAQEVTAAIKEVIANGQKIEQDWTALLGSYSQLPKRSSGK